MASVTLSMDDVASILRGLKGLLRVPAKRYWVDYDEEADVLYIAFQKPQKASVSELLANGVILRKRGKNVVGMTILDASKRR
jgi:uncharacterized protein YuzE